MKAAMDIIEAKSEVKRAKVDKDAANVRADTAELSEKTLKMQAKEAVDQNDIKNREKIQEHGKRSFRATEKLKNANTERMKKLSEQAEKDQARIAAQAEKE